MIINVLSLFFNSTFTQLLLNFYSTFTQLLGQTRFLVELKVELLNQTQPLLNQRKELIINVLCARLSWLSWLSRKQGYHRFLNFFFEKSEKLKSIQK